MTFGYYEMKASELIHRLYQLMQEAGGDLPVWVENGLNPSDPREAKEAMLVKECVEKGGEPHFEIV